MECLSGYSFLLPLPLTLPPTYVLYFLFVERVTAEGDSGMSEWLLLPSPGARSASVFTGDDTDWGSYKKWVSLSGGGGLKGCRMELVG